MERTGRRSKIHEPDTLHHVMMRGNNRKEIFFESIYYDKFLKILRDSLEKFDHEVLSYCLMTNHIHMIVYVHTTPLSVIMQNINFRYARWVNGKLGWIGHLFQGRYRSIVVNNEEYLVNLCRYIHRNPIEASMVNHINDYPWSSHQAYCLGMRKDWLSAELIKKIIEQKTGLSYQDFISQKPERNQWKPAMWLTDQGEIIVDDVLLRNAGDIIEAEVPLYLSDSQVIEVVCRHLEIDVEQLYRKNSGHAISKKRALLVYYLNRYTYFRMSQICIKFQRTQMALSKQVARIETEKNKIFPVVVEHIENELNALIR